MQSPLKSSIEPEFIHQEILLTEGVKIFFPTSCDETRNTVEDKYQFAGFYGFTLVNEFLSHLATSIIFQSLDLDWITFDE